MNDLWLILIPALPLLGFVLNGLFGRWLGRAGGWIAVLCMAGSAVIGGALFIGALTGKIPLPIRATLWEWMAVGDLTIRLGFFADQLTCLMLFFVTLVSTLVFLYSMGYMAGDPGFNRFFAYLCLFDFSMLILVLGDSLPLLFVGWEGVGLCSYLLIGFYLAMPGAADAGKKAFIVNRIGDFGFLVAMLMIFAALGTLDIQEVLGGARAANTDFAHPANKWFAHGSNYVTIVTLMLFLGCTGKSAQIPLFTWLPDAMAGPTPVSALIHAATMVTAGVYLMVRLSALFALAPTTLLIVAIVAAATAFVAGTIALTQRDIKKVLAYSTVSQLGYMFLACGCGAFVAGIFHVFTHAFFKGCLFLGAGSVIHAAHHEQDLFKMGGLRRAMPKTAITFLIACAAIAGVPLLAGFFSKDEILWKTFSSGYPIAPVLYGIALLTALMTAIYSFRAYFLAFEGKSRLPHEVEHHLHESPWTMTVPLIVLAVGALLVGYLNLPAPFVHLLGGHGDHGVIGAFLEPVVSPANEILAAGLHAGDHAHSTAQEWLLMGISTLVALAGIFIAWRLFLKKWPESAARVAAAFGPLYQLSAYRWWWDDFYRKFVAGGTWVVARVATWFDRNVIDGILHGLAGTAALGSQFVRGLQNGQVQAYAVAILLGVNLIIWLAVFFKKGSGVEISNLVNTQHVLLLAMTFLPLATAILIGIAQPSGRDGLSPWMALIGSIATFALSCVFIHGITADPGHYTAAVNIPWIESVNIRLLMGMDGLSGLLVLLTNLLVPLSVLASWTAIVKRRKEFYIFLLTLQTGILGTFLALDLILFYIFWEMMLVPLYFLIGIFGSGNRIYATMKFFLYTMAGSLLMLVGIIALYFLSGTESFALGDLLPAAGKLAPQAQMLIFLAFLIAFAIKVPLFPLHTWLPDAHTEAPTAGSVILAGVLLKTGVYGLLRFAIPLFPGPAAQFAPLIAGLAVIAIIYGALTALAQSDMKRLVAYSSVSHMGFIVLGIFAFKTEAVTGAALQMLNHGISTSGLFLCVGYLYERRHTRELAAFGGLAHNMKIYAVLTAIMVLSSVGLPGLNGFVGEFLILIGTYKAKAWWAVVAASGVILAACYLLRMMQMTFFGPLDKEENKCLKDLSLRESFTLVVLAIFAFWIGVYPAAYLRVLEPGANKVVEAVQVPGEMPNGGGMVAEGADALNEQESPERGDVIAAQSSLTGLGQ